MAAGGGSPCTTAKHMGSFIVVAHVLPPPLLLPDQHYSEQHNTLLSTAAAVAAAPGGVLAAPFTHTHKHTCGHQAAAPPGFRVINRDVASLCAWRPPTTVQNRQPSSRDRFLSVYCKTLYALRCVCAFANSFSAGRVFHSTTFVLAACLLLL